MKHLQLIENQINKIITGVLFIIVAIKSYLYREPELFVCITFPSSSSTASLMSYFGLP